MILRGYQGKTKADIHQGWERHRNMLAVLPTGSGKTAVFSKIMQEHIGASCAIAHRQELVSQISLALAGYGIRHKIIGPSKVIRWVVQLQVEEFGKSFYDGAAPCAVAGVDTIIRRKAELGEFFNQVSLWVIDEAHHVVRGNKWGKAVDLFPNARGLGVTATPCRADGKGLGAHADGVFNSMVVGPTMRELINQGYLADYRIFAPPNDLNLNGLIIGSSGDFSPKPLKQRVRESTITGDVVKHYLRLAPGKQGITFTTDVETATDVAAQFRAAGVPAEVLSAKTPDKLRVEIIRRFKNKVLKQIVNVDIFGEGVDIPAVEVISMARPTESYGLYVQQFGRGLRVLPGKDRAIIIDHVGNVMRHGLPDSPREWTLNRRNKKAEKNKDGLIPIKVCPECTSPYEAIHPACPYCGYVIIPADRSRPEYVEGDLTELDPTVLAKMRGEIDRIDSPNAILRTTMEHAGAPDMVIAGACKNHRRRQEAQILLRESIAWWAGHQTGDMKRIYKLFYFTFGVDVATAQALGRPDAEALSIRINKNIDAAVNGR